MRAPGPGEAVGLLVAATAAALAIALATVQAAWLGQAWIEALVLALLLGVLARNVLPAARSERLGPGAAYAAKQVLELGVALLGAGLAAQQVLAAGAPLLVLIVGGVFAAIGVGFLLGRSLGLNAKLALLVAVGNAVCGNSAIAAVAPVVRAEKKDVASAIGLTAVVGLGLVLGLPLLIGPLALSHYQYGVLAGMSVYAVPQVVAAAFPVSQVSGEVATLVKLGRVLMLGPIVLAAAFLFRGAATERRLGVYLPWFVVGFLGLASLRSLGVLPDAVALPAREASRLLTTVAMAGLGFGVELAAVRRVGPRVAAAALGALLFLAAATVAAVKLVALGA